METEIEKVALFLAYTVHISWYEGWVCLLFLSGSIKHSWPTKPLPALCLATGAMLAPFQEHFQITSVLSTPQLFILSFSGFSNHKLVLLLIPTGYLTTWIDYLIFYLPLYFNLWRMNSGIFPLFSSYQGKSFPFWALF